MFAFIQNMYVMGRYSASQIQTAVSKGYITQSEADQILS
jgi:uncharacterized XkdX family phage protein